MSFAKISEYFVTFLVALGFWLFLATIPPVRVGIWIDSELVLVIANIIFSAIGAGLVMLWLTRSRFFYSDQTICFFAIAAVSLITTIWAENRTLHHFGVPILGEGSVLFCGLFLLSAAYDNIPINNLIRISLIFSAIGAGLLVALHHPEHGLNINTEWLPYVFCAFLAPIALGVYMTNKVFNNQFVKAGVVCLSIVLLYLSHSKTAWVAVILCMCLWFLVRGLRNRDFFIRITGLSVPLLSLAIIYLLSDGNDFSSLESRKFAIQSYVEAWKDNPFSLIYGHGCGYYLENLQKQITQLPVKFFEGQVWKPSWDGIERLDFHCMHMGVEFLFSIGIVGLILYMVLLAIPMDNLKDQPFNKLIFVVLFAALTSTWFTLMCVWPFLIFCFAVLNRPKLSFKKSYFMLMTIALTSLCCGQAAVTYWNTAILYPVNNASLLRQFTYSNKKPEREKLLTSYNYKGLHFGHFLLNLTKKVNYMQPNILESEFSTLLDVYDANSSPVMLDVTMLHILQYYANNKNPRFDLWEQASLAILQKAPKRTDLVVPFVKELIESRQLEKAEVFIDLIKLQNPKDPFGMWLEGIYFVEQKEINKGRQLMQLALEQGIEKWIFIPDDLQAKLKKLPIG